MQIKELCDTYLLFYKGPITISLISFMGNYVKNVIKTESTISRKIFQIFIELVQNISYYSAESLEVEKNIKSGTGWFGIKEDKYFFLIQTGNIIFKDDGSKLKKNCDEINSLSEEELRELKRKTRSKSVIKDVGAHIGLIQSSLISKSKLYYNITEIDNNHSYFELEVKISKFVA